MDELKAGDWVRTKKGFTGKVISTKGENPLIWFGKKSISISKFYLKKINYVNILVKGKEKIFIPAKEADVLIDMFKRNKIYFKLEVFK